MLAADRMDVMLTDSQRRLCFIHIFCRRMKVNDYLQANIKEIPAGLDRINKTKERVSHAKCVLNWVSYSKLCSSLPFQTTN